MNEMRKMNIHKAGGKKACNGNEKDVINTDNEGPKTKHSKTAGEVAREIW